MSQNSHRALATVVAATLAMAVLTKTATAQDAKPGRVVHEAKELSMSQLNATNQQDQNDRREQRRKNKQKDEAQVEQKYPDATRVAPEASAGGKVYKELQALSKLVDAKDNQGVVAKAEQIAAMADANAYAKSYAYVNAGNAEADIGDEAKAVDYFKKAIEANGLDNNGHYASMHNLAAMQYGQDDKAGALATLDRFMSETKTEKPEDLTFRAGLLADLGRNDEALAAYRMLLTKTPEDKRVLLNVVSLLQDQEKYDEANGLLEDAYKRGLLTQPNEVRSLYLGYMNADRWDDAKRVLEDAVSKQILQPGPELARDYQALGYNAYSNDKMAQAIELYKKAAPMAADGEGYLLLAQMYDNDGKKAEAKAAAQQALDKGGLKKPETARAILAR